MDEKEFKMMVNEMHRQGMSDKDILMVMHEAFSRGKCTFEDFELMVNWLGYQLTDVFFKDHKIK